MALQLSASLNLTGSLNLSGSFSSTGTLQATSSWASNTISSSYAPTNTNITSSWSTNSATSSYVTASNVVGTINSSSYATNASFATSTTTANTLNTANSYQIINLTASNLSASSFTGSVFGTSSWTTNALTSALATSINFTASNSITSQTASYYNGSVVSSSYATTASFAPTNTNITASWATNSLTASSINFTASNSIFAQTASYVTSSKVIGTVASASWSENSRTASLLLGSVVSASYASSASYLTIENNYQISTLTSSTILFSSLNGSNGGITINCSDPSSGINPRIYFIYGFNGGGDFTSMSGSAELQSFGFNCGAAFGGTPDTDSGRTLYFYDRVNDAYYGGLAGNDKGLYWGYSNSNFSLRVLPPLDSNIPVTIKGTSGQAANLLSIVNSTNTALVNVSATGNVGIGSASPAYKLDVAGAISASSFIGSMLSSSYAQTASYTRLNKITASVDFGFTSSLEGTFATSTVSASWIQPTSILMFNVTSSNDHDIEDSIIDGLLFSTGNIQNGISFDIYCYAQNQTWGIYNVIITEITK